MYRVPLILLAASAIAAAGCDSAAPATSPASGDAQAATDASDSAGSGGDATIADVASADTGGPDATAPVDAAGPTDAAATGDTTAGACSPTPVAASYTATKVSDTTTLTALNWEASALQGGATHIKALKQLSMQALTGVGPGKSAPCLQLNISITLAGDPVVGTVYPIGIGANTANVDLNDFAGCEVAKMTTWNALAAPKKEGSVKLTAWDGSKMSLEFNGVLLPESKKGSGSFKLDGKFSSTCVK